MLRSLLVEDGAGAGGDFRAAVSGAVLACGGWVDDDSLAAMCCVAAPGELCCSGTPAGVAASWATASFAVDSAVGWDC